MGKLESGIDGIIVKGSYRPGSETGFTLTWRRFKRPLVTLVSFTIVLSNQG